MTVLRACGPRIRAGFSLVELIVALLLLSMGLVALAGAAAVAQLSFAEAAAAEHAANAAAAVIDSLMREPAIQSGSAGLGMVDVQWTVTAGGGVERIAVMTTVEYAGLAREFEFHAARLAVGTSP